MTIPPHDHWPPPGWKEPGERKPERRNRRTVVALMVFAAVALALAIWLT